MSLVLDLVIVGSVAWTVFSAFRWVGDTWRVGAEALDESDR